MDIEEMRFQLTARLKKNYKDFHNALFSMEHRDLIDSVDHIAKTKEVYECLQKLAYTESELTYLLKFQNPLDVITDHWENRAFDVEALGAVVAYVADQEADLADYPLVSDTLGQESEGGLHKFLNVNLRKVLPEIAAQQTACNQIVLKSVLDNIRKGAATSDPAKNNYVLIFRKYDMECLNERETFINGTTDFQRLQTCRTPANEPVLAYAVELKELGRKALRGNLYQVNPYQLAFIASHAAIPYVDAALTFSTVDHRSEVGDETALQAILDQEHERRNGLPKGNIETHLLYLKNQRFQSEVDRIVAGLEGLAEPNSQDKQRFEVTLSHHFQTLATDADMARLVEEISQKVEPRMRMAYIDGKSGRCVFLNQQSAEQKKTRKASIRKQLMMKPTHGDKSAAKSKNREVR